MDATHPKHDDTKQPPPPPEQGPKTVPENVRRPWFRAKCLLAPRSYEDIYHERAYLAAYAQQKTLRIASLINEYSETQTQLDSGVQGKTRRRLRKLLNLLRCKMDEASEQQRAIFSRLSELYMELSSREAWEQARAHPSHTPETDSPTAPAPTPAPAAAAAADDTTAPGTPCPSFASSDGSVASSVMIASPALTTDLAMADIAPPFVYEYYDQYALQSDYLHTVPEETEEPMAPKMAPTPPLSLPTPPVEEDIVQPWQGCNTEPEIGALEYEYVQYDDPAEDDDDDRRSVDGAASKSTYWKTCARRPSLPVIHFTWPDA